MFWGVMHGRAAEQAYVAGMVADAAAGRSRVAVVRGEAGIGKSALLAHAAELHGTGPVLRATGTEAESHLPFAGLHALLHPQRRRIDALPAPQARALRAAFGLGYGPASANDPPDTPGAHTPGPDTLGPAAAPGGDRFLVGLAVLTLLADLSEDAPLLCLVDDAQWLDRASADALLFAARRLTAEPVAVVFGARSGDRPFPADGIADIALAGLDPEPAAALLAEHHRDIAPAVRDRVVAEAEGNPLALIELSAMLGPEEKAGRLPALTLYTEAATPAGRVEAAYRDRIAALPERTAAALTLAAADGTGTLGLILRAADGLGLGTADLRPAEHAGLIRTAADRLTFRHPLAQAAAYRGAPLAARHTAHRALAAALAATLDGDTAARAEEPASDPAEDRDGTADRRAHHLAAATTGTDEDLGRLVEHAADRALRRGAPAVAASVYERAAHLTEHREPRAARLAAAAEAAATAGQLDRAHRLTARAARLSPRPDTAARLAAVTAALDFERGNAADAGRTAVAAAETLAATAPDQAVALLGAAAEYAWFAGDDDVLRRAGHLVEVAQRHSDAPLGNIAAVVQGTALLLAGDHAAGLARLRGAPADGAPAESPADGNGGRDANGTAGGPASDRMPEAAAQPQPQPQPQTVPVPGPAPSSEPAPTAGSAAGSAAGSRLGAAPGAGSADIVASTYAVFAALRTGGDHEALAAADALARTCRTQGRVSELTHALQLRIQAQIFLGRLPEADADAAEALRITDAIGHTGRARHIQGVLSLAAATRGDAVRCEELARHGLDGALAPGASWAGYARALLALGRGDHRRAADLITELQTGPVGHTVIVRFALPVLVEAAVRNGEPDLAAAPFTRFDAWARGSARPWALAVAERCRALLAAPDRREHHYLAALAHHEHATRPFEHARTLLLYGEWLRRARRRNDAAARLRAAAEILHGLGAAPWFDRAVAELTAIGARPRGTPPARAIDELAALTAQERQVVLLAATGAGNRDIAAQLFLSPRTVGYHLYNAFPKLGVTSRTELRRFHPPA